MKIHSLFCSLLIFITCCVFTWKAESTLGAVMGYIALIISLSALGKIIIDREAPRSR